MPSGLTARAKAIRKSKGAARRKEEKKIVQKELEELSKRQESRRRRLFGTDDEVVDSGADSSSCHCHGSEASDCEKDNDDYNPSQHSKAENHIECSSKQSDDTSLEPPLEAQRPSDRDRDYQPIQIIDNLRPIILPSFTDQSNVDGSTNVENNVYSRNGPVACRCSICRNEDVIIDEEKEMNSPMRTRYMSGRVPIFWSTDGVWNDERWMADNVISEIVIDRWRQSSLAFKIDELFDHVLILKKKRAKEVAYRSKFDTSNALTTRVRQYLADQGYGNKLSQSILRELVDTTNHEFVFDLSVVHDWCITESGALLERDYLFENDIDSGWEYLSNFESTDAIGIANFNLLLADQISTFEKRCVQSVIELDQFRAKLVALKSWTRDEDYEAYLIEQFGLSDEETHILLQKLTELSKKMDFCFDGMMKDAKILLPRPVTDFCGLLELLKQLLLFGSPRALLYAAFSYKCFNIVGIILEVAVDLTAANNDKHFSKEKETIFWGNLFMKEGGRLSVAHLMSLELSWLYYFCTTCPLKYDDAETLQFSLSKIVQFLDNGISIGRNLKCLRQISSSSMLEYLWDCGDARYLKFPLFSKLATVRNSPVTTWAILAFHNPVLANNDQLTKELTLFSALLTMRNFDGVAVFVERQYCPMSLEIRDQICENDDDEVSKEERRYLPAKEYLDDKDPLLIDLPKSTSIGGPLDTFIRIALQSSLYPEDLGYIPPLDKIKLYHSNSEPFYGNVFKIYDNFDGHSLEKVFLGKLDDLRDVRRVVFSEKVVVQGVTYRATIEKELKKPKIDAERKNTLRSKGNGKIVVDDVDFDRILHVGRKLADNLFGANGDA